MASDEIPSNGMSSEMSLEISSEISSKKMTSHAVNRNCYVKPARRAFMQSIKKTKSFKIVYNGGRKCANHYFVMYANANNDRISRLGITISKKVGNAVVRNKIRRLVKESCRLRARRLKQGYDIVIVARVAAGDMPIGGSYAKVDKALESLFSRLRILVSESNCGTEHN